MALQPIGAPTSTEDDSFTITTLREEEDEREKLVSGLSQFGIIQTEPGSGDSLSNMRPSSSKSTHNRNPTAEASLGSSDSEEDDNAPTTSRTEELGGHVSDSDVQIIYENSNESLASPQSSVSADDEENQFDTWQEAVVLSDNEQETPPVPGRSNRTRKMICHRCPTEKAGTFTNEEKFRIHVKRHIFGDIFQCTTCQRPFNKITFCISHEIRVHGTKLNYDNRDGVIKYAKRYVEERDAKRAQPNVAKKSAPSTSRRANRNANDETDEETDDEHPKFYNYPIMVSTALFCYQGPPVNSVLEAYEIQATHGRPRSKTANAIAQKAVDVHLKNVEEKHDTYKLKQCPFSKKKNASVGEKGKVSKRKRTKK